MKFEEFKSVRDNKEVLYKALITSIWNYDNTDDVQTMIIYALWQLLVDSGLEVEYKELIERYNAIHSIDMSEWEDIIAETEEMTVDEIIKTMKIAIAEAEWKYPVDYAATFDEAIKLIEKQKEKEAFQYVLGSQKYYCPSCNIELLDEEQDLRVMPDFTYCWKCGQHISWKGAKDNVRNNF